MPLIVNNMKKVHLLLRVIFVCKQRRLTKRFQSKVTKNLLLRQVKLLTHLAVLIKLQFSSHISCLYWQQITANLVDTVLLNVSPTYLSCGVLYVAIDRFCFTEINRSGNKSLINVMSMLKKKKIGRGKIKLIIFVKQYI